MLGDKDAIANIAVRDLARARQFYEGTLGLKPLSSKGEEAVIYQSGNSQLIVYHSQHAGTNQATSVIWPVGDKIEAVVSELRERGIRFEHYDLPAMSHKGDIHVGGEMQMAWFKDPDGNTLGLSND